MEGIAGAFLNIFFFGSTIVFFAAAVVAVELVAAFSLVDVLAVRYSLIVTDHRHCAETQDRHLEGSKTASTPPYILAADHY